MKKYLHYYLLLILIINLGLFNSKLQAQSKVSLQQKKELLLKELEELKKQQSESKDKSQRVLDSLIIIESQNDRMEQLISLSYQQTNYLEQSILKNNNTVAKLEHHLTDLQGNYVKLLRKIQKGYSSHKHLAFLLSSRDLTQAIQRFSYLKQYHYHRQNQVKKIKLHVDSVQKLNVYLDKQKQQKILLINTNQEKQKELKQIQKKQEKLVEVIKEDQVKFAKEIQKKQEETDHLEKQIKGLLRKAIASRNKKVKSQSVKVKDTKDKNTIELNDKTSQIVKRFESQKGKLPWPVSEGKVIGRFGKFQSKEFKYITRNNQAVEIKTAKNKAILSVFEGEVLAIKKFKGASSLVQVLHGNYITSYYNLKDVVVTLGQKVAAKDIIGHVRTDRTGKTSFKFLMHQNEKLLNPHKWIENL